MPFAKLSLFVRFVLIIIFLSLIFRRIVHSFVVARRLSSFEFFPHFCREKKKQIFLRVFHRNGKSHSTAQPTSKYVTATALLHRTDQIQRSAPQSLKNTHRKVDNTCTDRRRGKFLSHSRITFRLFFRSATLIGALHKSHRTAPSTVLLFVTLASSNRPIHRQFSHRQYDQITQIARNESILTREI